MKYRTKLTDAEYNAILKYTNRIHIDSELDIMTKDDSHDCFVDYSRLPHKSYLGLQNGLRQLWDAVAYPLVHDLDTPDAALLAKLFKEFNIITDAQMAWCMMPEKEEV